MRFQVLGPLAATGADGPLSLRAPKSRLLLAVLLSRAGQVVSSERLEEALWDGAPPSAGALRWQVHQVRSRLGADRLVRHDGGLALRIEPGELDAADFEQGVDTGRRLLRDDRPDQAAAALRDALALWRGDAYEGLAESSVLIDEVRRLQALRRAAVEQRIEADLMIGSDDDVIAELASLVDQDPLHERLRALQITALLRSGHRAAALAAYDDTRATLVRELGMEPGGELQELHQQLLHDHHTPASPPQLTAEPAGPAELPRRLTTFTGRTAELERLDGHLRRGAATVVVSGPGGMGKSALAVEVGHRLRSRFPDGQLYVDLQGSTPGVAPRDALDVLHRMLRSLGDDQASTVGDVEEAAARFRSATNGCRLLLLLDNAADAAQVRPLLPGADGCSVIITSRRALVTLEGAQGLRLDMLRDDEAGAMLTRHLGAERVGTDPVTAAEVAALCDHLPLALALAAARLAARPDWSLADLRDRLRDSSDRLAELAQDDRAVRASLAVSFDDLAPAASRLLLQLALLDAPEVTSQLAAAVADEADAEDLLEGLAADQLLEPVRRGRYLMHDLTRLFARERAAAALTELDREAAVQRGLHWFLASARSALGVGGFSPRRRWDRGVPTADLGVAVPEPSSPEEATRWLDQEVTGLLAATVQAVRAGADQQLAVALVAAATPALSARGMHHERRTLTAAVLETAGPTDAAWLHIDAAHAYLYLGDNGAAEMHGRKAVRLYAELADPVGTANALMMLGGALEGQGWPDQAADLYRSAMDLGEADPEGYVGVNAGNNLADALMTLGRFAEAAATAEQILERTRALGLPRHEAFGLITLGEARLRCGEPAAALTALTDAADRLQKQREPAAEGLARWRCGEALAQLDRIDEARDQWRASIEVLTELGRISQEEARELLASPRPDPPPALTLPI